MNKKMALMLCILLCQEGFAQSESACKQAEEDIADASVKIAVMYNSFDFDKTKELGRDLGLSITRGEKASKECNCAGVGEPLSRAKVITRKALEQADFSEVQNALADAVFETEKARNAAEMCWRKIALQSSEENSRASK